MVLWNFRRTVTTSSLSPSWVKRRSALVMLSSAMQTTLEDQRAPQPRR